MSLSLALPFFFFSSFFSPHLPVRQQPISGPPCHLRATLHLSPSAAPSFSRLRLIQSLLPVRRKTRRTFGFRELIPGDGASENLASKSHFFFLNKKKKKYFAAAVRAPQPSQMCQRGVHTGLCHPEGLF